MRLFSFLQHILIISTHSQSNNYWIEGDNAVLTVDIDNINNYSVSINNTKWLIGGEPNVWCNSQWHSVSNNTLIPQSSTATKFSGNDPILGSYNGIKMSYNIENCMSLNKNNAIFEILFTYYSNHDIFTFTQNYPNGLLDTSIPQFLNPPTGPYEFDINIPISEFPAFSYKNTSLLYNDLGYIEWNGRQLDMINFGIGLDQFIGGSEGGPVLFFEDGVKPTSGIVLSTLNNFMNGIWSIRTRRGNNNQCVLENNIDFKQNDIVLFNASSISDCCNLCSKYSYCNVFSFVSQKSKCYLKYNDRGKTPTNGHTSGYISSINDDYFVGGIEGNASFIPYNYSISFVLSALNGKGIHQTLYKWGDFLLQKYQTNRLPKSNDLMRYSLGYWTDNGAYYMGKQPLTTSIAQKLFAAFNANNIPIRYLQLDPYWYMGGSNSNIGSVWIPRTDLFPNGLTDLYNKIGSIPLLLYSSNWTPTKTVNYYNKNYNLSLDFVNSVHYAKNNQKQISEPYGYDSSYEFYKFIVLQYNELMIGFEVDFMDYEYLEFEIFVNGNNNDKLLNYSQQWTKGMNDAICNNFKYISIQYCMSLPNYILQSLLYNCVTNARASQDNVPTHHTRWKIAYTASFYSAIKIAPFFDNIWTTSVQPGNPYNASSEPDVELEAIISLLGNGPFGIGDAINMTNITIINRIVRNDGILLHPSKSITPIDAMYYSNRSLNHNGNKPINGELWMTHSQINTTINYYVLAIDVDISYNLIYKDLFPIPNTNDNKEFIVYQFADNIDNINGQCENNTNVNDCNLIQFSDNIPLKVLTTSPPLNNLEHLHSWNLYGIIMKQINGWYILGEMSKYCSVSPDRFISIQVTNNPSGIKCIVSGSPNEVIVITFVSNQNIIIQRKVQFNQHGDNQDIYVHS